MKLSKKWLIFIAIFVVLALVMFVVYLNRDFFAHYFRSYEVIDYPRFTEQYLWEHDGISVLYLEGELDRRNLWINKNTWEVSNYTPKKVTDRQDAIAVGTYIKNNSAYTKHYELTEYIIVAVAYDIRYNVWRVTFRPPDVHWGADGYMVDVGICVIFRGYNGEILYIGPEFVAD